MSNHPDLDYISQASQIFDAIQRERNWQIAKYGNMPCTLEGYLVLIEGELEEAKQAWRKNRDNKDCLRELLQVATLCVRALEQHGVVEQEEFNHETT